MINAIFGPQEPIADVGETVFLRAVNFHYIGTVSKVTPGWLELQDASWVAYSGRFGDALRAGPPRGWESEYMGSVRIPLGAISDATTWQHTLPSKSLP